MESPKHVVVVGCLVRNAADAVLLIRHRKRGWELPQGRVEEGENLVEATHREIFEETGVHIDLGPLAAVYSKVSPPPAIIFNFLARYREGELTASEESPELGWFSEAQALELVSHPVNQDRVKTLLGYAGEVCYRSYSSSPFKVHVTTGWG